MKENIVSIDAVISRIEINGWIDCTELGGYMEDYEYDNIIYYLKKYKYLQNRIDKAIEYIEKNDNSELGIHQTEFLDKHDLLNILKGNGE